MEWIQNSVRSAVLTKAKYSHIIIIIIIQNVECNNIAKGQRWARYFFKVPAVPVLGTLLKVPSTGT